VDVGAHDGLAQVFQATYRGAASLVEVLLRVLSALLRVREALLSPKEVVGLVSGRAASSAASTGSVADLSPLREDPSDSLEGDNEGGYGGDGRRDHGDERDGRSTDREQAGARGEGGG